jgi:hypothetical protein
MNLTGRPVSIIYGLLLASCAWLAWRQMLGWAFGMGESAGGIGFVGAALLVVTSLGILGLALAALGFLIRPPLLALIAMISIVAILPETLIFLRQSGGIPILRWDDPQFAAPGAIVFILDLVAGLFSWLRYRQLTRKSTPALPSQS